MLFLFSRIDWKSKRLFMYKEIGSLTPDESQKAIEEPAKKY